MEDRLLESLKAGSVFYRDEEGNPAGRLIVLVHGFRSDAVRFHGLCNAIIADEDFADCDILPIRYDKQSGLTANTDPDTLAEGISSQIDVLVRQRDYQRLLVLGWSVGGVLTRAAILKNLQQRGENSFVHRIERLVLLASTNRGFSVGFWSRLGLAVGAALRKSRLIRSMMRESNFILNLRMNWIRTFESEAGASPPSTVQIRGAADTIVKSDDSSDIFRFANSQQLTVIGRNHFDIVEVEGKDDPLFQQTYKAAFLLPIEEISDQERRAVDDVVFIVHGIRDYGKWQVAIERELGNADAKIEVRRIRYGYFNLIGFILPFIRRSKSRSFVDDYIDCLARFPSARFHYVGHSNGTYILGYALRKFPSIRLGSVYLAGAVLPSDYRWDRLKRGQVTRLINECGSADWPVGFLCAFLSTFTDLGTGGFRGFHRTGGLDYHERLYVHGNHGRPIKGDRAPFIARWILENDSDSVGPLTDKPNPLINFLSRFAFPAAVVIIGIAVAIGALLFIQVPCPIGLILGSLYVLLILIVLGWF